MLQKLLNEYASVHSSTVCIAVSADDDEDELELEKLVSSGHISDYKYKNTPNPSAPYGYWECTLTTRAISVNNNRNNSTSYKNTFSSNGSSNYNSSTGNSTGGLNGKIIAIIVVAIIILIALISNANESERNRVGSSIDWGDGYYWNSSTESVERTIWD